MDRLNASVEELAEDIRLNVVDVADFNDPDKLGKGKDMHGKRGKDLVIRVPVGTICKDADTDEVLWDC